jgi:hypothetical protein
MTPFTQILMQARKGEVADRLTEELASIIEAIDATGKGGELTLKVKISPEKGGGNAKDFEFDVSAKLPRAPLPKAIFYSDSAGDLFRTDPSQTEMRFEDAEERRARN